MIDPKQLEFRIKQKKYFGKNYFIPYYSINGGEFIKIEYSKEYLTEEKAQNRIEQFKKNICKR